MTPETPMSAAAPSPEQLGGASAAGSPAGPASAAETGTSPIVDWLRKILRCPQCRSELRDGHGPSGGPELQCCDPGCGLAYRVDDGIPVLLVDEARPPKS